MTYDAFESSSESGEPVTLFLFANGNTEYTYTNHTEAIVFGGKTYAPVAIKAGKIVASGDMTKNQLKIDIDWGTGLAALLRGLPESKSISLVLYEGHLSDPAKEFIVSWSGLVIGSSRTNSKVTVVCDSVAAAIRGLGLGRDYQLTCPYALYSTHECKADQVAATLSVAVLTVSGRLLTFTPGWRTETLDKYLHGVVTWTGGNGTEVRSIIATDVSLEQLKLGGSLPDLIPTQLVSISLGCNRRENDCTALFNNIVNFGGQPFIPIENPTGTNSF